MRVIGGLYRSRTLAPVPSKGTRPTTDRVREAWASTMTTLLGDNFEDSTVLDAFAGSGALGIELLSRGAKKVVFCENTFLAQKTLRSNLAALGINESSSAQLLSFDILAEKSLHTLAASAPFAAVILDPPYRMSSEKIATLLAGLAQAEALKNGCVISYEKALGSRLGDEALNAWLEAIPSPSQTSFILEARKTYGTVALDYFRVSA